jgi:hypothetical protein
MPPPADRGKGPGTEGEGVSALRPNPRTRALLRVREYHKRKSNSWRPPKRGHRCSSCLSDCFCRTRKAPPAVGPVCGRPLQAGDICTEMQPLYHCRLVFAVPSHKISTLSCSLKHLKSNLAARIIWIGIDLLSSYVNSLPWAYSPHRTHFIWFCISTRISAWFHFLPLFTPAWQIYRFSSVSSTCSHWHDVRLTGANAGAISWLPCHLDRT